MTKLFSFRIGNLSITLTNDGSTFWFTPSVFYSPGDFSLFAITLFTINLLFVYHEEER